MTVTAQTLQSFIEREKVIRSADLATLLGNRMRIRAEVAAGTVTPLGAGIYASPSLDPIKATIIATARFFPRAVISGITALVFYGLSDEVISTIDVDVDKATSIRNQLLNVRRVSKKTLKGTTLTNFLGEKIKIYNIERALCDAYRIDPDGPILYKAVKRYVKRYKPNLEKIAYYDKLLKTNVLNSVRQELADA